MYLFGARSLLLKIAFYLTLSKNGITVFTCLHVLQLHVQKEKEYRSHGPRILLNNRHIAEPLCFSLYTIYKGTGR